jgi:hypothetical protein
MSREECLAGGVKRLPPSPKNYSTPAVSACLKYPAGRRF